MRFSAVRLHPIVRQLDLDCTSLGSRSDFETQTGARRCRKRMPQTGQRAARASLSMENPILGVGGPFLFMKPPTALCIMEKPKRSFV